MTVELAASRSYPAAVDHAYDVVLPAALPRVFSRRYLALPAIRETQGDEPWGTVGQRRRIVLADGGSMVETLTLADRPHAFGYRIDGLKGPLAALVSDFDGRWDFEPEGSGVRITWRWVLRPRGRLGVAAMPVFRRMWQGYARQGLEEIEGLLGP